MSEIVKEIELERIHPNKVNPRLDMDFELLNELAESIRQVGLLEPLIVRPVDDEYEIVIGERRYRAAKLAGLKKVPVIVREYGDVEVIELGLVENIHREDLSAVEKGNCCKQLMDKYPKKYPTVKDLSRKLGVSNATINSWLLLVSAPIEIQKMIAPAEKIGVPRGEGKIDWDTAVTITRRIKEPERQIEVAHEIAKRRIYRRTAREVISRVAKEPEKPVEDVIREVVETPYEMPFRLSHMKPVLKGVKTQTSRKGIPDPKVKVGAIIHASIWEPHFADLRITSIERKRLKDFDAQDAEREGGYTLEEFQKVWKKIHEEWKDDEFVYVIHFEKVR